MRLSGGLFFSILFFALMLAVPLLAPSVSLAAASDYGIAAIAHEPGMPLTIERSESFMAVKDCQTCGVKDTVKHYLHGGSIKQDKVAFGYILVGGYKYRPGWKTERPC